MVNYAPGPLPFKPEDIGRYLQEELYKIRASLQAASEGHIDELFEAPAKPRSGDVRLADGTYWNPGAGQGVYCYYGSAWHKLG